MACGEADRGDARCGFTCKFRATPLGPPLGTALLGTAAGLAGFGALGSAVMARTPATAAAAAAAFAPGSARRPLIAASPLDSLSATKYLAAVACRSTEICTGLSALRSNSATFLSGRPSTFLPATARRMSPAAIPAVCAGLISPLARLGVAVTTTWQPQRSPKAKPSVPSFFVIRYSQMRPRSALDCVQVFDMSCAVGSIVSPLNVFWPSD